MYRTIHTYTRPQYPDGHYTVVVITQLKIKYVNDRAFADDGKYVINYEYFGSLIKFWYSCTRISKVCIKQNLHRNPLITDNTKDALLPLKFNIMFNKIPTLKYNVCLNVELPKKKL